jgi:hypothetical protein
MGIYLSRQAHGVVQANFDPVANQNMTYEMIRKYSTPDRPTAKAATQFLDELRHARGASDTQNMLSGVGQDGTSNDI